MTTHPVSSREWLEADGFGGFASGTSTGIRTRRYHALLLTATTPPTGRLVLVNGFDAWIETPKGRFALTSQRYAPDVIHPDGAQRIEGFSVEPWPKWLFKFQHGTELVHEIFVAGEAVWLLTTTASPALSRKHDLSVKRFLDCLRENERMRRAEFPSRLHRAADAYIVNGRHGKTIMAGYPWFTDWGRDTFIALRGLCLATGRLADARDILLAWANSVAEGMLPNLFPDNGAKPEYNSVDASLWYVIAVHELLAACNVNGGIVSAKDKRAFQDAILAILEGYSKGTRFGIRMDDDGLLAAGERGVQLTWMDAKVGEWVVTPRAGKPVEIQALWLNALKIASQFAPQWEAVFQRGLKSFLDKFWNEKAGCLYDVIDANHRAGEVDAAFRPNQIFAVGGLPFQLLEGERAERVVSLVEEKLWTPIGLRSLAPGEPDYRPHYECGVMQRDGSYHQGTVWPWLIWPFVEAWVRVRGNTTEARPETRP